MRHDTAKSYVHSFVHSIQNESDTPLQFFVNQSQVLCIEYQKPSQMAHHPMSLDAAGNVLVTSTLYSICAINA